MSIITRVLRQDAVYWAPNSTLGYDGKPEGFDAPIAVKVRWTDEEKFHVLESGTQVISQSEVMINIDVKKEGYLWLGDLSEVSGVTNPREQENAWEIMRFEKIPNLRATEFLRQAYMTWQK
jgi:hypothetical protein